MNKQQIEDLVGKGFTKEQIAVMAELLANIKYDQVSYIEAASTAFCIEFGTVMESVRDGNKPSSDALTRMIAIALADMAGRMETIRTIQEDVARRAIDS